MASEDDNFDFTEVPEYEAELPAGGADDDVDDIAALVSNMMGAKEATAAGRAEAAAAPGIRAEAHELPSATEDFIRNFLLRARLHRTLDTFNSEWYHLKAQGALPEDLLTSGSGGVPDIYSQNERLQDLTTRLRTELTHAQEIATKAQATWDKFRKERDFHRMHHSRVVQEKNRLITDIRRLKRHYEAYEPTIQELRARYEATMREKMLVKVDRDKLAAAVSALEGRVRALEASGAGRAPSMLDDPSGAPAATAGGSSPARAGAGAHGSTAGGAAATVRGGGVSSGAAGATGAAGKMWRRQPQPAATGGAAAGATASGAPAHQPGGIKLPDMPNPFAALEFEPVHAEGYRAQGSIKAHTSSVTALALHPTKPVLVTGCDGGAWRLWGMPDVELALTGEGHRAWISDVAINPSGSHLATADGTGVVKVWNLASQTLSATLAEHVQAVWSLSWHSSGDALATGSMDHTAKLWDIHSGKVKKTLKGHVDCINSVAWQPYSSVLATASGDKTVSLWDARTGLCVQTFYGHTNAVKDLAWSLRGDMLASCDADGAVRVWDVRKVSEHAAVSVAARVPIHALALDRSGSVLAAGCEDGSIHLLSLSDAGTLDPLTVLRGHTDGVQALAFDPQSQYLVSGGADCTVRLWSDAPLAGSRLVSAAGSHMSAAYGGSGVGASAGSMGVMGSYDDY